MSVCISCCTEYAPPGKLCAACAAQMIDAILGQVSAEDQAKPIDEIAPRVIEFEIKHG